MLGLSSGSPSAFGFIQLIFCGYISPHLCHSVVKSRKNIIPDQKTIWCEGPAQHVFVHSTKVADHANLSEDYQEEREGWLIAGKYSRSDVHRHRQS